MKPKRIGEYARHGLVPRKKPKARNKPSKEERKRLLIEMMKEDEKNGMYEEPSDELIAVFMGEKIHNYGESPVYLEGPGFPNEPPYEAEYQTSWDALMPVVEKIESLGYDVDICGQNCMISEGTPQGDGGKYFRAMIDIDKHPKITAVYEAVVEFIWWHTSQQHERK